MGTIKTQTGLNIEAILLVEIPEGRIWFAQDRIVATDENNCMLNSADSAFDAANIIEKLKNQIVENSTEFVINRINPDHSLTEVLRSRSEERIKALYLLLSVCADTHICRHSLSMVSGFPISLLSLTMGTSTFFVTSTCFSSM